MQKVLISTINRISSFLGLLCGVLICILACILIYDVFMRFVINRPLDWSLDVTQLLQAAIAFLSAAYVLKIDGHVNMAAIVSCLSPRRQQRMGIITYTVTGFTSGWMAILSWSLFTKSLAISERAFGIDMPLAPWKLLVPIGFGIMCLQALAMALSLWLYPERSLSGAEEGH